MSTAIYRAAGEEAAEKMTADGLDRTRARSGRYRPARRPASPTGAAGTRARTTLCGTVADVVRKVGLFDPDRPAQTCQQRVWWEAIRGTDDLAATIGRARRSRRPART